MVVAAPVVGRTVELARIEGFSRGIADGPASLVIEGFAGIGKTVLWAEAVAMTQHLGAVVLSCRCTESDAGWAFSGLGDLLEGLAAEPVETLPEIQQRALAVALLTSDPAHEPNSDRIVAVAVLNVLRALARGRPVLVAVDDVQWLDSDTRKVLSFALRRLRAEPVRLLTSYRTGPGSGPVPNPPHTADLGLPGERIAVGAASIGTLQRIVQLQLGEHFSRPILTRLHQATGGNPMMFLEMSRALQRQGRDLQVDEPLPVPADLRSLVSERLLGLSAPTRQLLLVTAALAHPTLAGVAAATSDPDEYAEALAEALGAGVIEVDGDRIRFTHPLIGSTPYDDLPPERRRRLHERLAETVSDPEQHARHAALGSAAASASVAAALDVAARLARDRGSIDSAAELADLAMDATPIEDRSDRLRRTVAAAELQFLLGETARARMTLTAGLAAAPSGPGRVLGLLLQARIASSEEGDARVAQLCTQAIDESGDDLLLRACSHAAFAETSPSGPETDLLHAQIAVDLLQQLDTPPPGLLANALTNLALHHCRLGHGFDGSTLERAVALESLGPRPPVSDRAGMALGMCLKVVDQFADSRRWLQAMRTSAIEEGDDSALPNILGHLATLECWVGDYPLALRYAIEGRDQVHRMGVRAPMLLSAHVLVLSHLGRLSEARDLGERDLAEDEAISFESALPLHLRSLGVTELFAGRADVAATRFLRALAISRDSVGIGEPAIMRLHADAVSALVITGDLAEAERLTVELESSSARNHLPWSTAMASHCRGAISAASGDLPVAVASLQRALGEHERLAMPFEQARTRLLLGSVLRRSGRRSDARRALEAAHVVFVRLSTPIQADQALAQLAAVSRPATAKGELTAAEGRIVSLVAAGQTSREVATTLVMSVRTVDSHLGHIYRKLGLRSRTELAVWMSLQESGVDRATP